ncbi:hypothetical protein FSP39_006721 [Pinctada imbricata]|uniref:Cadherin domain-containing protein n=1 Tax=Pinctada imbricata TaxID=66713 RepID=A0AA88XQI6_PINIB|nr:hypothetical protein FSP39_006721 [Pinctada imbricata]
MNDNTDTTRYTMQIQVSDQGVPSLTSNQRANVVINVVRNNVPPTFINAPYATTINRTVSQGSVVFTVSAQDTDVQAPYNTIEYDIIGDDNAVVFFNVDRNSGVVRLSQNLLSDQSTRYVVRLRARDGGNPRLSSTTLLTISVVRNLVAPVFLQNSYTTTIPETQAPGSVVLTVTARDADISSPDNTFSYYFSSQTNQVDRFYLDPSTGQISVRRILSGEIQDSFTYNVYAVDNGSPQLTSNTVQVTINIRRNQFPPTFQNEPYSRAITSSAGPGTSIITVTATDADTFAPFNVVTYSIIGDDTAPNLFNINSVSGFISMSNNINTDGSSFYQIRVVASDGGNPSLTDVTLVYVNVTRNLFAPAFNPVQYAVSIPESQSLGTPIRTVTATDQDATSPNNVVVYTLTGDNRALEYFRVDSSSGAVSLIKPVSADPITNSNYQLVVTARDLGSPSRAATNTATVTVSVFRNNNAPVFTQTPYAATVDRTSSTGAQIYTVTAVDADVQAPYNTLTLSVIGDDNAPNLFSLQQQGNNAGIIRVISSQDLASDTATSYKLRLMVADGGVPARTGTATVDITVRRNLFPPVFINSFIQITIPEGTAVGTFVTNVTATDADVEAPNNVVRYDVIGENDAPTYFYVNPVDGTITLLRSVLNTGASGYRLRVRALDQGFPQLSAIATVEISISRQTEVLSFILPSYTQVISENRVLGSSVIQVTAQPGPGVNYRLIGFSDGPDYFNISASTGSIGIRTDLRTDLNKKGIYYLQVEATRTFTTTVQTAYTTVNITVTRNENPPVFSRQIYEVTIPETSALGASVVQLTATDADAFDVINYQMVTSVGTTENFYLGPISGLISLRTILTATNTNRYQFNVVASDQSQPARSATATVIVNVLRSNFPPVFVNTPYSTGASIGTAVGTSIYRVTASDADLLLGIMAYDTSAPSQIAYENVTIVVNRNPNAPFFQPSSYSRVVGEDFAPGSSLFQLTASDNDGPSNTEDFFYLNADTGLITLARSLTQTSTNNFQLTVMVTDNGIPVRQANSPAIVSLTVLRNQFDPFFVSSPYVATIQETTNIGTSVLQVTARDQDTNQVFSNITYALIGDDTMPSYFSLNTVTGAISVRSSLTAEIRDSYQGRIVAFDGGSPPRSATAIATINILRNLNSPIFNPTNYEQTILETLTVGSSILQVTASDADRSVSIPIKLYNAVILKLFRYQNSYNIRFVYSPNNQFRFQISDVNSIAATYFQIDSVSGRLTVRVPLNLDNAITNVYRFNVIATDLGSSPRTSVPAQVTINVIRNQNPPVFIQEPYSTTIPFTVLAGSSIFDVNATDADTQAPFNTITYSIIGDERAPTLFSINQVSGVITTSSTSLFSDPNTLYTIRVLAQDGGSVPRTDTSTVLVSVTRNLFDPQFNTQNYSITIFETQNLGESIQQILAQDRDASAPYNTITYSLVNNQFGNNAATLEYFDINPTAGFIYVKKSLTLTPINTFVFTPYFLNEPYRVDLGANVNIGTSIIDVDALDNDGTVGYLLHCSYVFLFFQQTPFGQVTYDIIGDDSAPTYFTINSVSGQITISRSLTEQSLEEYRIRVRARDGGVPFRFNTSVVIVTMQRNFQAPLWSAQSYQQTVVETLSLGTVILTVNATDGDPLPPHNTVRYFITADQEDLDCFLINEVTGDLALRRSLLYDPCRANVFNMKVTARDLGTPQLSSSAIDVSVFVTRNQNPPVFFNTPYSTQIEETSAIGRFVYQVTTNDADTLSPFNVVRYSIIGDDSATNFFAINEVQGNVSLRSSVNFDSTSNYKIRVLAYDGGIPSLSATATIDVLVQRNLFAPVFNPINYNVTIYETQALGVPFIKVNATDADTRSPHNVIRYTASSGAFGNSAALEFFQVSALDGSISVKKALTVGNRNVNRYVMTVQATDEGVPNRASQQSASVTINILRNLNCPVFTNLPNNITVSQSTVLGSRIFNVSAFDQDEGIFSALTYDLIGDDNAPVYFRIDQNIGSVFLQANLFSDTGSEYKLRVRARDGGSPACESYAVLTVSVRRNEFAPTWIPSAVYTTTILETHNVLTPVYTVQATDRDISSPNNVIRYNVVSQTSNSDLFYSNDATGQIYIRSNVLGNNINQYNISLVASDLGFPSLSSVTALLIVNILRNQNPPVFINEPYSTVISQNLGVFSSVITVTATDADSTNPFNVLEYSIIGDDAAPTYFQISSTTGVISMRQSISSDPTDVYTIRVRVQDGGNPRLSDTTTVTVTVNRNLFAPIFSPSSYSRTILDTQDPGVQILRLTANDADTTSPHNLVRYTLSGDANILTYFMVDDVTGDVSLRRSVYNTTFTQNNQNLNSVNFQSFAYDLGSPRRNSSIPASIFITIIRNNFPPQFVSTPYSINIAESTSGGSSVFQTTAVDQDTNAPFNVITYSLIGDDSTPTYFFVEPTTGLIRLRQTADLTTDTSSRYVARVVASDGGFPSRSATATVLITVLRNLFSPVFSNLDFIRLSIPETTPVGTFIVDLNATDADRTSPENVVACGINGDGLSPNYFFINPTTCVITLLQSVNNIGTNFFRIQVQAFDAGSPQRSTFTYVEVTIIRSQGTLQFTLPSYAITISENKLVNTDVITTLAQPGVPTYRLLGLSPGPTYFNISQTTGTIFVRTDLKNDVNRLQFYQLLVEAQASDGVSTQTAQAFVNITVTRNENGPIFTQDLYSTTIVDTTPIGNSLLTILAPDADGDIVDYTVISVSNATDFFYLNPRTGIISLKTYLFSTTQNFYRFTVRASDQRVPERTDTAEVQINILRDSFPPVFIQEPYATSVSENTINGTTIYTVTATDQDLRGSIQYEVIGISVAPAFFVINRNTGVITVFDAAAMKADRGLQYTLRVVAYDSVYPNNRDTSDVLISINRNENPPIFTLPSYTQTIPDTFSLGQMILDVSATDSDGDVIKYEITGGSRALEFYYINPDTGAISLKKPLTEGQQSQDIINLRARDQRSPERFATSTATINIQRDQFPPVFINQPYITTIQRNVPTTQTILQTSATDSDLRGSIVYQVTGNYPAPTFFEVNSTTGLIFLARPVSQDSLLTTTYFLRLIAYDSVYPNIQTTATATINVNRNPNGPQFTSVDYRQTISEDHALGSAVIDVNATDADGDILRYTMIGDNEDFSYFYTNPETGLISLKRTLRDAVTNQFQFVVQVSDQSNPERTADSNVIINVLRDEEPPFFFNTPYQTSVLETTVVSSSVYAVTASDPDLRGSIVYGVIGDFQTPFYFDIDTATGRIFIKSDLKQDIATSYVMRVTAYDSLSPSKVATATVNIGVIRNPSAPVFQAPSYEVTIPETYSLGVTVVNVTAIDPDGDIVRYSLLDNLSGNNPLNFFFIIQESGLIYLSRPLTETSISRFTMTARATDQRSSPRTADASVVVNVLRNRFVPTFVNTPYSFGHSENDALGRSLYRVTAVDSDLAGSIFYSVIGDGIAPYYYAVNSSNGFITLRNVLTTDRINTNYVDRVVYTANGDNETLQYFYIAVDTGLICVRQPLYGPTQTEYRMRMVASDQGNPERFGFADAFITVIRDQSPPFFINQPYSTSIEETSVISRQVYLVTAIDNDLVGQIRYEMIGDYPTQSFFTINTVTGNITTTANLKSDSLRSTQYIARVTAYDSARINARATATVAIFVVRNPNGPIFSLPSYGTTINENQAIGQFLLNVTATDLDPSDTVTYFIDGQISSPFGTNVQYFYIDQLNGNIWLRESLLSTSFTQFILRLRACDNGFPQRCANNTATISVNRNQFPPVFVNSPYFQTIQETAQTGSSVLVVTATDSDLIGQIVYESVLPGSPFFSVNPTSGLINLAATVRLDTSLQYTFKVAAYDSQDPTRRATADVTVQITRNPSGPFFLQTQNYETTIPETFPLGDLVINTTAVDNDGDVVHYSITGDDFALQFFYINPDTGVISLRRLLTSTNIARFTISLRASDQRVPERTATATAFVNVIRDNQPPFFFNTPYSRAISENQVVNQTLLTVTANDNDLVGSIRYESIGLFPAESFFQVNTVNGNINIIRSVLEDVILRSSYTLRVVAYDTAYPANRATADVFISVTRDEFGPVFQPSATYQITIPESTSIGSNVITVLAVDQDQNDIVTYEMVNATSNGTQFFYLDRDTGSITLRRTLLGTFINFYTLTIRATDNRIRSALATVRISITRTVDALPIFINTPYRTSIRYDRAVNSTIYTITATDADLRGQIRYELMGYFPATDYFTLNSVTGQITLTNTIRNDQYTTLLYVLRIEAYDTANPSQRVAEDVLIDVLRNPSSPVFTNNFYVTTIPETQGLGTSILRVNATDADGDVVGYEIDTTFQGNNALNFFFLSSTSGEIYVRNSLASTGQDQYTFTTQAVNSSIPFITVTATDNDLKESIRYTAVGDGAALAFFFMSPTNGQIFVYRDLRTDSLSQYILRVEAFDTYYPNNRGAATVTINIIRNPSAPIFSQNSYETTINENFPVGDEVIRATATDADGLEKNPNILTIIIVILQDFVTYRLVAQSPNDYFYVAPDTGSIYLRRSVQLNTNANRYQLIVQASDNRTPQARFTNVTVFINIVRGQPPFFVNEPYATTVNERSAIGTSVYRVSAVDSDLIGQLQFVVVGDIPASSYFRVNMTTGEVFTNVDLRQDNRQVYTLRLQVYDSAVSYQTDETTVSISMIRNENPPIFIEEPYVTTVSESFGIGQSIYRITATDADLDTIRYSITGITSGISNLDLSGYFYLNPDTGVIFLTRSLTISGLSAFSQISISVQASDQRTTQERVDNSVVTINIQRDQFPPVFQNVPYGTSMVDTASVNSTVFTVSAVDSDLRGRIAYEAIGVYPAQSFFTVDNVDGRIRLIQTLANDGLYRTSYTLRVIAYDTLVPAQQATADVVISVARNVNPPIFTQQNYQRTVTENYALGIPIISVMATDRDVTDVVTYTILGDNNNGFSLSYFFIDRTNGSIYLRQPLTNTNVNQFTFTVQAMDSGRPMRTATSQVTIFVTRNQFAPAFIQTPYSTSVQENTANGTQIYTVTAVDQDLTGVIVYEVIGTAAAPSFFRVDQNGRIFTFGNLRTDISLVYVLRIRAYDSQVPSQTAEADVTINMLRNVNPPIFSSETYSVRIAEETAVGTLVIDTTATDSDNDRLTYAIASTDARCLQFFFMNSDNGDIFLRTSLLDTSELTYTCTISVTDNGYPQAQSDTATAIISINRDVNVPVFSNNARYAVTIDESTGVTSSIIRVSASRIGIVGRIYYESIGDYPAQSFFAVQNTSGDVTVTSNLRQDNLRLNSYLLRVVAYDTAVSRLRATAEVYITVLRNLVGPIFNPATYEVTIREDIAVNTYIQKLNVSDPDGDRVTCSMSGDNLALTYFSVDADTCLVRILRPLTDDLSRTVRYTISITASDNVSPNPQVSSATVFVNVLRDLFSPRFTNIPTTITARLQAYDTAYPLNRAQADLSIQVVRNQFGPVFNPTRYERTISENFPLGNEVFALTASDADGDAVTFIHLGSAQDQNYFYLNPETGRISLKNVLTATGLNQFTFQVRATDSRPVGVGEIRYRLDGFNPGTNYFFLNSVTGEIFVRSSLDQLTVNNIFTSFTSLHTIQLCQKLQLQETVVISISRNLNTPLFSRASYQATIYDYFGIGTSVVQVTATDADITSPENSIIFDINDNTGYFNIHPFNGMITINRQLSEDSTSDQGSPGLVGTASVTVTVIRNAGQPTFINTNNYDVTISEGKPVLENIIQVSARDSDDSSTLNGQIVYSIQGPAAALPIFQIDPINGNITARVSLLNAPDDIYRLNVFATDRGIPSRSSQTTVTIRIIREGLPRFDQAEYVVTYGEDLAVGSNIIQLQATDPLPGTLLLYDITGEGSAITMFSINQATGQITLAQSFRTDTSASFLIRVETYRQSDNTKRASTKVRVIVTRNSGAPAFIHGNLEITINEAQAIGVQIVNVNATDPDSGENGRITYLVSGADSVPTYSDSYFYVNPISGVVYVTRSLTDDNLRPARYVLSIVAFDNGVPQLSGRMTVTINVVRNRNAPVFDAPVIRDNDRGNSSIWIQHHHRTSHRCRSGSLYFNINPATGVITVDAALTQSGLEQFVLTIQAVDVPSQSSTPRFGTVQVTINILRNPNAPVFSQGLYNYHHFRTDSGRIKYSVIRSSYTPANSFSQFVISESAGGIYLSQPLTREGVPNNFELIVQAEDSAVNAKSATSTVSIFIVRNLNAPTFAQQLYSANVFDASAVGTSLFTVTAVDNDRIVPLNTDTPNAEFDYIIDPDYPYEGGFFDVTKDGVVYVRKSLINADRRTLFKFYIVAVDRSWKPLAGRAEIRVNVTYTSTTPRGVGFTAGLYQIDTFESIATGTRLGLFNVENHDPDTVLVCEILNVDPVSGSTYFSVQPQGNACELLVAGNIDREVNAEFIVVIRVREQSIRTKRQAVLSNTYVYNTFQNATVIVRVSDINDNPPIFQYPVYPLTLQTNTFYVGAIPIDAAAGSSVMSVYATDIDAAQNGEVRYSKVDSNNSPFSVNSIDGEITTNSEFFKDSNYVSQYRFTVQATDQAPLNTRESRNTQIYINLIEDINRFILQYNVPPETSLANLENIRQKLQNGTNKIVLIEKVTARRDLLNGQLNYDERYSDITFVISDQNRGYQLAENTDSSLSILGDAGTAAGSLGQIYVDLNRNVDDVRKPYEAANIQGINSALAANRNIVRVMTKSYIWWMDDPWAALVALAAIIVLLSIVGIIILAVSWSRYNNYLASYRVYRRNYEHQPDFTNPPSFLKEYETQVGNNVN